MKIKAVLVSRLILERDIEILLLSCPPSWIIKDTACYVTSGVKQRLTVRDTV